MAADAIAMTPGNATAIHRSRPGRLRRARSDSLWCWRGLIPI